MRLESNIKIRGGYGGEILGDVLLRIGIIPAAELGIDGGGLVGGHARAAAKCHVLLGMGGAREAGGRLIAADVKIQLDGRHRSQRIAHDDDLQAIGQRGSRDRAGAGSGVRKGGAGGKEEQQRQQGF